MAKEKSSYKVSREGKLIVLEVYGDQTIEAVLAMRRATEELLTKRHGPRDILVRHQGPVERFDPEVIDTTMKSLREVPFSRIAVVGTNPRRLGLSHRMFRAMDAPERFKIFRDESLARAWLSGTAIPLHRRITDKVAAILGTEKK